MDNAVAEISGDGKNSLGHDISVMPVLFCISHSLSLEQ
jgi:hypothetical protein